MDYNAIRQEIVNFINEQELPMVADQLLDEIARSAPEQSFRRFLLECRSCHTSS